MEWDVWMDEAEAALCHYGDGRLALGFRLQMRAASRKIKQNSAGGKTRKELIKTERN